MKIILTHEVENLGVPGDVVEVKDGYGRNYLIPRGYATNWTKGAQRQIDQMQEARRRRATETLESARELRDALEENMMFIRKSAGANGRLFGAVSTRDVAAAAEELTGKKIDHRSISITGNIKSIGEYDVKIKLHPEIEAKGRIKVEPAK